MSRDAVIYTIQKSSFKKMESIDINDIEYNGYLYETEQNAPDYLKQTGTTVRIRYHLSNWQKACQDFFGSNYDCAEWRGDGLRFFSDNKELGFVFNENLKKYDYDEDKICYIAKIDEICTADNCYRLKLGSGIYTFDELLDECIRIVTDDEFECEQNLIYALVKAMKHSRDGKKIYIYVD